MQINQGDEWQLTYAKRQRISREAGKGFPAFYFIPLLRFFCLFGAIVSNETGLGQGLVEHRQVSGRSIGG